MNLFGNVSDTITFDNTYSLFRGKKIHYSINVVTPPEHLKESDIEKLIENANLDEQINDSDIVSRM